MIRNNYAQRLSGGKPNSLGHTEEVVAEVLATPATFDELFEAYFSDDELVRLRVSNAMKRIAKASPELLHPYLDRLLDEVAFIPQASTQWTLAQLLLVYEEQLSPKQRTTAIELLKRCFDESPQPAAWHKDWIVLNMTMNTLQHWSKSNPELRAWFIPHLARLASDPRKSVAGRASKFLKVWQQ